MDESAPLMNVDWIRWFAAVQRAIETPIAGISPEQITIASGFLLGRTTAGPGSAETISVTGPLTLAAGALGITGSALTRVNDTNVTLTLTGSPTVALLAAAGLTLGWTGMLGLGRGGTAADLSATGGASQVLKQSSVGAAVTVGVLSGSDITGAALTKTDDTNITLTLGGTPTTALLRAASLTLGWTGTLSVARGGTGNGTGPATAAITNDTTTNATMFPTWVTANTGDLPLKVTSTKLTFNPSTGFLAVNSSAAIAPITVGPDGIAAVATDGVVLQNATLSTALVPVQRAPRLRFRANVWNTTSVANNTYDWTTETIPTSGAPPICELRTESSLNGASTVLRWRLSASAIGTAATAQIQHPDNTSGTSQAQIQAMVGGSSGGDPSLVLGIGGGVNWTVGLDNSDGDNFKIGQNIAVGTSTAVTIDGTRLGVGIGISPTAMLHLKAGTATASTAPLKLTSGTNLTTAEAGAMEYNGTNLFFTRAGTVRENMLVAIDNVAAPTTSIGVAIVNYYGANATNYLGDPNRWLSVNILGTVYRIALYT